MRTKKYSVIKRQKITRAQIAKLGTFTNYDEAFGFLMSYSKLWNMQGYFSRDRVFYSDGLHDYLVIAR